MLSGLIVHRWGAAEQLPFFENIDGLVMERSTYDFIFNYGAWPYGDKPTFVCTSRALKTLESANIEIAKTPEEATQRALSLGLQHLWLVGGGKLASSFLKGRLLTHLWISEMPIALEKGIPLFANYTLDKLQTKNTSVLQKKGFKEIKKTLNNK